jgi:hypothetical protein
MTKERFNEFISDTSNHDVFITKNLEVPYNVFLNIFYEDRKFREKELIFKINLN